MQKTTRKRDIVDVDTPIYMYMYMYIYIHIYMQQTTRKPDIVNVDTPRKDRIEAVIIFIQQQTQVHVHLDFLIFVLCVRAHQKCGGH